MGDPAMMGHSFLGAAGSPEKTSVVRLEGFQFPELETLDRSGPSFADAHSALRS
jgi:hypothetical protein